MNFVTWSIRNPVPVFMMFVTLVLGGLIAFPRLAVQNQPDIQFPFVFVQVSYPGVPPSQMETEVTRKVEERTAAIVESNVASTVDGAADVFHAQQALGLLGMCERAHMLGGHLELSNPPGSGGRVQVRTPIDFKVRGLPTALPPLPQLCIQPTLPP